jgi:UDP-glucose 4-epimerase
MLALNALAKSGRSFTYNLGNGTGFSVQQVISAAEHVTGRNIAVREAPRRAGDAARLVANAERAREELGWHPRYPKLTDIIAHAWQWEQICCGRAGNKE